MSDILFWQARHLYTSKIESFKNEYGLCFVLWLGFGYSNIYGALIRSKASARIKASSSIRDSSTIMFRVNVMVVARVRARARARVRARARLDNG